MKTLIHNPLASSGLRIALILLGLALVGGFCFVEGLFYANRRATVRMANDGCFLAWSGLTALNDPVNRRLAILLDSEMDSSGSKLAEMSLRFPGLIDRGNYNLLIRVRNYRKTYGRGPERNPNIDPAKVDAEIAQAIAYLESIHDTNQWLAYNTELNDLILKSKSGR
jgi:hypothetical protein